MLSHEWENISGTGLESPRLSLGESAKLTLGIEADGRLNDPILRSRIALFEIRAEAFRAASERFADELKHGRAHPAQAPMIKYFGTELNKQRYELMMAGGGSDAVEWDSERSQQGVDARAWLRTKANSIEGGTSEVQLNIIAKRILQLPGG